MDPLPEDAPQFLKDYHAYYKCPRGYHERSGNSTDGWNVIGCQSFLNQPLLAFAHEIETPVLLIHGEKPTRDTSASMPSKRCQASM